MTTPETLRESEAPRTEQELRTLEAQVSWDYRKFETLLKNTTLKSWLDKIIKKESETTISTFWKWYKDNELSRHLFIESWTKRAINMHPDLAGFICWDLWLPYSETSYISGTKFNELTFEQKMWFISFQEALWYYSWDISGISSNDFINQCKALMNEHAKSMTGRFNAKLTSSQNFLQEVTWLVELKKFLKKEYWLTDTECEKVEDYIELTNKHPEYVWWVSNEWIKPVEAWWFFSPQFWSAVKRLIIAWLVIWWVNELKSCASLTPPETRVYGDSTEITNFKEVFRVMSAQVDTDSHRRQISEEWLWHFDERTGCRIAKWAKWVWNRIIEWINVAQHRNLDLELKTQIGYLFDFETAKCNVEVKNWRWIFHVKVKKPEVKIVSEEAKIYKSRRERINVNQFDDFDLRAVEILRKEALDKAKKPENIEKAKESLRNDILSVFKTTWYANSQMIILAEDVQDVVIEYIDDELHVFF